MEADVVTTVSLEETLEHTWKQLQQEVEEELLELVLRRPPGLFERLVMDLLVAMGYGRWRTNAGQAGGWHAGDGGIDGIVTEDPLALNLVCVQAKRWRGAVGRPVVQGFAGSLDGVHAQRGVLMTTSWFSPDARAYVEHIEKRVALIDGSTLTRLMLEHGVGVTRTHEYPLFRVKMDYFHQE